MIRITIIMAALAIATGAAAADRKDSHDHGGGAKAHEHEVHEHDAGKSAAASQRAKLEAAVKAGGERVVVDMLGVVCDFCATSLKKTFAKRAEVAATYVDLDEKTLAIALKPGKSLDDATIEKLVRKSGYKIKAVRRGAAAQAASTAAAKTDAPEHEKD